MNARIKIPSDGLYVHIEATTQGPFTRTVIDELFSAGKLTRATPLWYYGLSGWITVGDVPEFDRRAQVGPPPLPAQVKASDLIVGLQGKAQAVAPLKVQQMIANHDLRRADYVFHHATQEWIRMDQHPQTRKFFNDPTVPVTNINEYSAKTVVPTARHSNHRRTFAVGFSLVGLFTLLSAGAYYYWTLSPKYALWQVAKAWQKKDWDKLTRFVDVQKVMTNAVNDIVEKDGTTPNTTDPYATNWKQQLTEAFGERFKPSMVAFLSSAVEGYFKVSAMEQNAVIPIPGLHGALAAFDPKRMGIQAQGLNDLEVNGNSAKLYVGFHHKVHKKDFEVEVLFEKDQRWKVVAITNVVEILEQFEEWDTQAPMELERPITDRRGR